MNRAYPMVGARKEYDSSRDIDFSADGGEEGCIWTDPEDMVREGG